MHVRSRHRSALLVLLALVVAACAPDPGSPTPAATLADGTPASSADATPAATEVAGASDAPSSGPSQAPTVSQTDTEWGRIWDAVPAGFPRYPGGTTADDATADPVSAAYAIPDGDPAQVADWMQSSLELATFRTEGLSGPFEDGAYVLDSVGAGDCRIETRIAPQGSLILVTVLYGAGCPA
uniref:Lipoprotein n=1 Tax=uncultured bacterium 148 TaxID=698380 RepID=E3T6N3_9BACT|nr:hypothetical protein [uncultured bacterium 148]